MLTPRQLVFYISAHSNQIGYEYLTYALELVRSDHSYIHKLTKELYPAVALQFGVDRRTAGRAIARAVSDCWENGSRGRLEEVVGRQVLTKPTPGELIAYLAGYLDRQDPDI